MEMAGFNSVLLHCSLIDGIGPVAINQLLEQKPSSLAWGDLYHFSPSQWRSTFRCSERTAQLFAAGLADKRMLEDELRLIEKQRTHCITIDQAIYPPLLKAIHAPPPVLYCATQDLSILTNKSVAVVGSRDADRYGQQVVQALVPPLVHAGLVIVSGGARGIDGMAHSTAMDAGGKTVAILGSGLCKPYPREHIPLFDQMVSASGALVSIFPMSTAPSPGNFPARNRVIAGLSGGTLVIQAAAESGARITAQHALEQGRDVFAVPGPIDHPLSAGCHALIQEGAKLTSCAADILSEFGYTFMASSVPLEKIRSTPKESGNVPKPQSSSSCSMRDRILYACSKPATIDDLIVTISCSLDELQHTLFDLHLEGLLEQNVAGQWEKK